MKKDISAIVWLQGLVIAVMMVLSVPFFGCSVGDSGTTPPPATQSSGSVDAVAPEKPVPQNTSIGNAGPIEVPINLKGASNVGGLSFDLVYDPAVLEVTTVKAGTLAQNAIIDSNTKTLGHLIIGIVSSNGINGNGAVANVTFKSKAMTGTSALTPVKVEAYSADKLQDIKTQVSAGQFNAKDSSSIAPSISF